MTVLLLIRNESPYKRLYRTPELKKLAERVCSGENAPGNAEISLLFCGDAFITELNNKYRNKNAPTDVLAFAQPAELAASARRSKAFWPLGDVVISLETVARRCTGPEEERLRRAAMRQEVRLLFCHGLLHLLGSDHASERNRASMNAKQARYLGITEEAAWHFSHKRGNV